ncbi:MAG: DsrE family protein [Gammaproteobacteria bacterium]|nr:DsrE family protein [Gammaproteobacteria bacterium]
MKIFRNVALAAIALILAGVVQAEDEMLVPGFGAGRDLPGAHLAPDPNTEYKVVFDLTVTDDNLDDPYPFLPAIAVYMNTLQKFGVPAENRKIAIVLHQGSGLIGLKNEEFKARNDGKDNPNIDLIQKLGAAGVTFHICGQGVLAREIDPEDLLPEIQVDYWALTTLIELGRQGYVKIG